MVSETCTSGLKWLGREDDHLNSIQCHRLRNVKAMPSQKGQGLQGTVMPMPVSVTGMESGIWSNVNR